MANYKSSVSIEATPEEVFDFVSDVRNLPRYFRALTAAEPTGGDEVRVTAEEGGRIRMSEGWFRVHEGRRHRLDWGLEGPDAYKGWMEVDPEGEVASVTVELHLEGGAGDVDTELDRALFALKAAIEGDGVPEPTEGGASSSP